MLTQVKFSICNIKYSKVHLMRKRRRESGKRKKGREREEVKKRDKGKGKGEVEGGKQEEGKRGILRLTLPLGTTTYHTFPSYPNVLSPNDSCLSFLLHPTLIIPLNTSIKILISLSVTIKSNEHHLFYLSLVLQSTDTNDPPFTLKLPLAPANHFILEVLLIYFFLVSSQS